jgi:predicted nucleotidyltransferase
MIEDQGRRAEVLAAAERCVEYLKTRYNPRRVLVFGSALRPGQWHQGSDLDIAVEGLPPEHFFRIWSELDDLLPRGLRLDLVPLEDASPELRARILGEVDVPDDPVLALRGLVEDELRALTRIAVKMRETLDRLADPPTEVELQAIASYLHQFYTGIESIFERIALQLDGGLPRGAMWHLDLLNQMAEARPGLRPAVIDEQLWSRLKLYLDFRHFFRHAYGFELRWVKLRTLAEGMDETLALLRACLDRSWGEFPAR